MTTLKQRIAHSLDRASIQRLIADYKANGGDLRSLSVPAWYEYGFDSDAEYSAYLDEQMEATVTPTGVRVRTI